MLADRLKILRRELNMTKRELVSELQIKYSTYANYETGFREPSSEVMLQLANHFGVSMDYLIGASDNRKRADDIAVLTDVEHDHITGYRRLDTHGREVVDMLIKKELERISLAAEKPQEKKWVTMQVYEQGASGGLRSYLSDNISYESVRFVATEISKQADFCVRINSDSMKPKICTDDVVFVKTVPKVDIGSVGIFVYGGEVHCMCIKFDNKKGSLFLDPLNAAHAPVYVASPDALRTVGLVIGMAEK